MKLLLAFLFVSSIADPTMAQGGPPFVYDSGSACDDIDDEMRMTTGLIAARVVSDIATGRAPASVASDMDYRLTTYQHTYDVCIMAEWNAEKALLDGNDASLDRATAARWAELMRVWAATFDQVSGAEASSVDARQDARIRAHYDWILGMIRSRTYLRRVQHVRIAMQTVLADALQSSVACRIAEKSGGDSSACESALASSLDGMHASFTDWTDVYGSMAEARGAVIDGNAARQQNDTTRTAQLTQASYDTRNAMSNDLWPNLTAMHLQAKSASAQRDYCWSVGYYYYSVGDYDSAYAWWAWVSYYDHQIQDLTTNHIPNLESYLRQLGDQATAMDAEVVRLQGEIKQLAQETARSRQYLVSGIL